MLVACWSAKGGNGTTVVSAGLAGLLARSSPPALLVDLAGDLPSVLGLPEPGLGLFDWLASGAGVEALDRLEVGASAGLTLLPRGTPAPGDREGVADALVHRGRPVVVDCGLLASPAALEVAGCASLSVLVTRPCYLSLRRALAAPVRPSAVVVVDDGDRSLRPRDVEDVLDAPVAAVVPWRPVIARAVDAGLLGRRVPPDLARPLRGLVATVSRVAAA